MNILNKVTWKAMWKNRTRTLVTIVGIILSAAMFTAVTTMGYSIWSYLVDISLTETGDYFLRYDYATDENKDKVLAHSGIRNAGDLQILGFTTFEREREDGYINREVTIIAAGDDDFFNMVTVNLEEGRLPQNSSEIVITRNVYYYLKNSGISSELGDSVTLNAVAQCPKNIEIEIPSEGADFERTYTIVGIGDYFTRLGDDTLTCSHLFTYADENTESAIWHRVYVKTWLPFAAESMAKNAPQGVIAEVNYDLTSLYGVTQYSNLSTVILAAGVILIAIIMVGSVSLIYNAFSISVSERTKQFGLLSSIGATKKQIRRSVRFEALVLSAIGIPIGILCGYVGISVTMRILRYSINMLFDSYDIKLQTVPSVVAFVGAGLICLATVLLSARRPARRATKIPPLEAIRQTQDYQIPKRMKKSAGRSGKKLPVFMAKKYYTVSKKKYRATVISLAISISLFLSAFTFGNILSIAADDEVNTNNFDILCSRLTEEQVKKIRNNKKVENSALWQSCYYHVEIPQSEQTQDYWQDCKTFEENAVQINMVYKELKVVYLEDEVLRAYLTEQGIAPDPYFDPKSPLALVAQASFAVYVPDKENGGFTRQTLKSDVFADGVEEVFVYPDTVPKEVREYITKLMGQGQGLVLLNQRQTEENIVGYDFHYSVNHEGTSGGVMEMSKEYLTVQCVRQVDEQGAVSFAYYLYDRESQTHEQEPIYVWEQVELPTYRVGASVEKLPYGVSTSLYSDEDSVTLILPLSALAEQENKWSLSISVNDHDGFLDDMSESEISMMDYLKEEMYLRALKQLVDVFSYGFIILISLICVANVFNTISTNVALRRRDFGMLRSVGMTNGDIHRMMIHECLIYGVRALLWGLPIGIALSLGIQKVFHGSLGGTVTLPWGAVLIVAVCVFAVVFASMFYAVAKLRKDNPIEAIRTENI